MATFLQDAGVYNYTLRSEVHVDRCVLPLLLLMLKMVFSHDLNMRYQKL